MGSRLDTNSDMASLGQSQLAAPGDIAQDFGLALVAHFQGLGDKGDMAAVGP
jgi:hypothetical protein